MRLRARSQQPHGGIPEPRASRQPSVLGSRPQLDRVCANLATPAGDRDFPPESPLRSVKRSLHADVDSRLSRGFASDVASLLVISRLPTRTHRALAAAASAWLWAVWETRSVFQAARGKREAFSKVAVGVLVGKPKAFPQPSTATVSRVTVHGRSRIKPSAAVHFSTRSPALTRRGCCRTLMLEVVRHANKAHPALGIRTHRESQGICGVNRSLSIAVGVRLLRCLGGE